MRKLFRDIKQIVGFDCYSPAEPIRGSDLQKDQTLDRAYLLIEDDRIVEVGSMNNCPSDSAAAMVIDASDRYILPTWVDSHTHIVWHGSRENEYEMRIQGATYEEIAAAGGGILHSAERLALASEEELYDHAMSRLDQVIKMGTGAIEIKSGYGLSTASEIKILRVIAEMKRQSPIPIKATFLGAHAVPKAFSSNRSGYIDQIIHEMMPQIHKEGLADYIDVFCDQGFFTIEETERILDAAKPYGWKAKLHVNELANIGGVEMAVRRGALSVDHLEQIGQVEIQALQSGNTLPVVLPNVSFFLGIPYAPARAIIAAGLPLVLASDYNPGSSPSGNMEFVLSLACTKMKLTPYEAVRAATINGAFAIELNEELGSITPGKRANFILTKPMPSLAYMPYHFGQTCIEEVWINGQLYQGL